MSKQQDTNVAHLTTDPLLARVQPGMHSDVRVGSVSPTPHNQPPTPSCIGIIMDGNRRWARERGLPTFMGHQQGYEKLKEVRQWCREAEVSHVIVYAFSTENWKRSNEEVAHLMDLFHMALEQIAADRQPDEATHFVGDLARFPDDLQEKMHATEEANPADAAFHLWIAVSYSGRAELTRAVNVLASRGTGPFSDEDISRALWTVGLPEPDIIIRTGGERRLSGFLAWQSVYAELFFVDTLWPSFSKEEFERVLVQFAARKRNYGV